jgi:hypothetical protein
VLWIATRLGCLQIFNFGLFTHGLLRLATRKQPNPGCHRKATGCLTKFLTRNLPRIECYCFKHLIFRLYSNFSLNGEPYRVNTFTFFRDFIIFWSLLEKRK